MQPRGNGVYASLWISEESELVVYVFSTVSLFCDCRFKDSFMSCCVEQIL